MTAADILERAKTLQQQGQLASAEELYKKFLELEPSNFEVLNALGILSGQSGQLERAARYFEEAIAADPNNPSPYCNRGMALSQLNQLGAAVASFDQAIRLNLSDPIPYFCRGNSYRALGQLDRALADFEKALALNPLMAQAHFRRGTVLQQTQCLDAAITSYDRAVAIKHDFAEAFANRGVVLHMLNKLDAAVASLEQAIAIREDPTTYLHLGNALKDLNRRDAAIRSYDRAIGIKADYAEAYSNRGVILFELDRIDDALASYDRAIALRPDAAETYFNRGSVLRIAQRFETAIADFRTAAALKPDLPFLQGASLEARLQVCDWENIEVDSAQISAGLERGEPTAHPFAFLTFSDSSRLQRKAAETLVSAAFPADNSLGTIARRAPGGKLRIGYFSADFRAHPLARLIAKVIEAHDRTRFEVVGFSFGPDTRDPMRKRLEGAFDRFNDVRGQPDRDVALLARNSAIDIAVDLGGYTASSRTRIFAMRSAPVQVNYLGYPGTMGSDYMDYLIADETLVLREDQKYYSEKIIYLPVFQANDSTKEIADRVFTRAELKLPSNAFVFCCFNTNYKILPGTFGSWMRILARVPNSVLFLDARSETTVRNLRKEALKRGVDPTRLIFGTPLSLPEWLARHRVADLFLDTLPYNAGTTASDVLWAGLPVLTCTGSTFTGRMATSLLKSIELPELIATTQEQYEALAVELALSPQRMADIRQKLAKNRVTTPLFNQDVFARHLESAYTSIHARYMADLPPDNVFVGADIGI
jgi:predicted O-linked N-acetylglucosamine transferase (SPINDLY family)